MEDYEYQTIISALTNERADLIGLLRAVRATDFCPECRDGSGRYAHQVILGYDDDGNALAGCEAIECKWCHDVDEFLFTYRDKTKDG